MSKTRKVQRDEQVMTTVTRATKKTVVWSKQARRDRKHDKAVLGRMCRTGGGADTVY